VWGVREALLAHVVGEGENARLEYRWTHAVALLPRRIAKDGRKGGKVKGWQGGQGGKDLEEQFRASLNFRYVRVGSPHPTLTARAIKRQKEEKEGKQRGGGEEKGKGKKRHRSGTRLGTSATSSSTPRCAARAVLDLTSGP